MRSLRLILSCCSLFGATLFAAGPAHASFNTDPLGIGHLISHWPEYQPYVIAVLVLCVLTISDFLFAVVVSVVAKSVFPTLVSVVLIIVNVIILVFSDAEPFSKLVGASAVFVLHHLWLLLSLFVMWRSSRQARNDALSRNPESKTV